MKGIKLCSLVALFAMTMFLVGCGSEGSTEGATETTTEMETTTEETPETTPEATTETVDKSGKEYTSTYVCKMHCEGSGSEEAGKCPACGMDYIASADLETDTDTEETTEEGDGHDHDSHEGHNH